MNGQDSARALLSGGLVQRRAYWNRLIATWDQIAIAGTLAVWAAVRPWEAMTAEELAIRVASAGAISSVLLAVWRWQARYTDNAIVGLNAATRLAEGELLPLDFLCTVKKPDIACARLAFSLDTVDSDATPIQVPNTAYGSRGHTLLDVFALLLTLLPGLAAWRLCVRAGSITLDHALCLRFPSFLLVVNALAVLWVGGCWLWWRQQTHPWPQAKNTSAVPAGQGAVPSNVPPSPASP